MEKLKNFLQRVISGQKRLDLTDIGKENFWNNWIRRYEKEEVNHWRKKAQVLYGLLIKEGYRRFIFELDPKNQCRVLELLNNFLSLNKTSQTDGKKPEELAIELSAILFLHYGLLRADNTDNNKVTQTKKDFLKYFGWLKIPNDALNSFLVHVIERLTLEGGFLDEDYKGFLANLFLKLSDQDQNNFNLHPDIQKVVDQMKLSRLEKPYLKTG